MVIVKTSDSMLFEEAYFVVRQGGAARDRDMMTEANRIIESCGERRKEKRKERQGKILIPLGMFMGGSMLGSMITFVLMLILRAA